MEWYINVVLRAVGAVVGHWTLLKIVNPQYTFVVLTADADFWGLLTFDVNLMIIVIFPPFSVVGCDGTYDGYEKLHKFCCRLS